jgi:hypothetical protein
MQRDSDRSPDVSAMGVTSVTSADTGLDGCLILREPTALSQSGTDPYEPSSRFSARFKSRLHKREWLGSTPEGRRPQIGRCVSDALVSLRDAL